MEQFDVIIVGGGPAGSTLAARLPKHVKALVIDQRYLLTEERLYEREKSCGGLLDETAQKVVAQLGLSLSRNVMVEPQVFAIRAIDFESQMERYYQRKYVNIDRTQFDADLLRRAAARPRVTVWQGATARGICEGPHAVSVKVRKATGESVTVYGRYLVGADGAGSMVRSYVEKKGKKHEIGRYASIQEWHPMPKPLPYYVATFHEAVTDFYSWVIPEGDQMILGSAIPAGPDVQRRFDQFKVDLASKGFDVSTPLKRRGAIILRPRFWGSVTGGSGRIFLVGEAAGLISPSSCEGISFALRSGAGLAGALSWQAGGVAVSRMRYEKALLPLKMSIALKSLKSPIMYGKTWRALVFKSRALSISMYKNE